MKKVAIILVTLVINLIFINKLNALTGYTTGTDVIVRTEPRIESSTKLTIISAKNTTLNIIDTTLHNPGGECSTGFYKISYNGREAYVCGNFVSIGNTPDNNPSFNDDSYSARIYGYSIYAKESPYSSSSTKHTLLTGTNVTIIGDKISGSGCAEGWYKIKYYKNDIGYVCSTYVRKKEELIGTNPSYEQELKSRGFPDSYIPYLVKLHEMHPNWKFNAIQTNLNWEKVISLEENKNAINNVFVNSTVREVYSKGDYGEKGWQTSTDAVNAFFLDPRNFLSEKFIFMFEALGYNYGSDDKNNFNKDSASTKAYYNSLTNMLGSSFLNTDEYKYMFIKAGFENKVSPIHLVGRAIQEGASNSNYVAVTGNSGYYYRDKLLNGYYNFYNIGAYTDSYTNNPVLRGIAYACGSYCGAVSSNDYGQPWDTHEKAIFGGAKFISGGYISKGQNTLYFQKFNTSPSSGYNHGTHQYQANVTAPASEGIDAFLAYKDAGLVDSPIEFDIPIYSNMPSVVSLPEIASIVNTLKEIKIDGKLISGYDKDVVDYTVYVQDTKSSVKIEVTKDDSQSTVTGEGTINLNGNETNHEIVVTAENGAKKTYRIKIIKSKDTTSVDDILSKLSVKVTGDTMNHISPGTHINTIEQSVYKFSPTSNVTVYTASGNVINGTNLLSTGQTIKITSPNGETRRFNIVVSGDTNGDGQSTILDLLQIQKHLLGSTLLSGHNLKAADVNNDGNVTILDLLVVKKQLLGEKLY